MGTAKLGTEVRQEQIAEAALALIATQGVKGLSMAAVARRVGLVPSALYRHFKSKDQILDTALDFIGERMLAGVETVLGQSADPLEQLRLLLLRHVQAIRDNQGIPRVLFSEDAYGARPERRAKVLRMVRRYLDAVTAIVRRGQQQKRIREDIDPATVALMLLGLIQPGAVLWHMTNGDFDVTKQTEKAWALLSEAIAT
jgi:AcrR family transcriptional regulator